MNLVAQQKPFDCGIACVAMWTHIDYPDVYALAVAKIGGKLRRGILLYELRDMLKDLGHPMRTVHHAKVDLEEDSGILGLNWTHTTGGHWVILRKGTLIDPAKAQVWDSDEYVRVHQARVGSLLAEAS